MSSDILKKLGMSPRPGGLNTTMENHSVPFQAWKKLRNKLLKQWGGRPPRLKDLASNDEMDGTECPSNWDCTSRVLTCRRNGSWNPRRTNLLGF